MLNVIENEQLIVEVRSFESPRTWRERLFSIPWEPWILTKMTPSMIPDGDFYMLEGGNTIMIHPDTLGTAMFDNKEYRIITYAEYLKNMQD